MTVGTSDTLWSGQADVKNYLQSGFTSTFVDSISVSGIDVNNTDISQGGAATIHWIGQGDDKLYRQSAAPFTSTMQDSQLISASDGEPQGVSWDQTNTPWCGSVNAWLFLQSEQFTSTVAATLSVSTVDVNPNGISYHSGDTPWIGEEADKFYLQSGQFSSTIRKSQAIGTVTDLDPQGINWANPDTLWCGNENDILVWQSGEFTTTAKQTLGVGPSGANIDSIPRGIDLAIVQQVGLATETDTAFDVTPLRVKTIGLATETDTAFPISASQTIVTALVRGLTECELAAAPVVNEALVKLGAARITSLVQDHPNARIAQDIYLDELDAELRAHVWNFAKTKRKLAQSSTAPVSGWDYIYPFPPDCLRVVNVHANDQESVQPPYEIVGRAIQTDAIECYLTYIRRECDNTVWDDSFFQVMAYRLAVEMFGSVSGLVSDRKKLRNGYRRAVARARSTDAIEDYPEIMPEDSFLAVRH